MGIKDYHTWIKISHPKSLINPNTNNIYEFIYIDMNYILHTSIYNSSTMNDFVKKIYYHLDVIFSNFIATKKIFFAIDGTSSFSKIILQRERRNTFITKPTNDISSICLSPGTKMIKIIEDKIEIYIANLINKYKFIKPEMVFSKSCEPDEGEIKICRQVFLNGSGFGQSNDRHLIIGNDADIIVLSMALKPVYNINILFNTNNGRELLSLHKLLESFMTILNKKYDIDLIKNSDLRDDYVLISLMMGNDYFPKMEYVNYIKLWDCYYTFSKQNNGTLINDGKFNVKNMKSFMHLLYSNLTIAGKRVTVKTYDKNRVNSYLNGLLWCLKTYNNGQCTDYTYTYTGGKSVHPYEIYFHLFAENIDYDIKVTIPINSEYYPLLIMPLTAKHLIPEKYHKLMDKELKYIYDMENCTKCKKLKDTYLLTVNKIKTCSNDALAEKFNKMYNEQLCEYTKHKKTHTRKFCSEDINHIIKLCDAIK